MNKNNILFELLNKQLSNIPENNKLTYKDLARILRYIDTSIFQTQCTLWTGNISDKIYFCFKYNKVCLRRLLYINFIGNINDDEEIIVTCKNSESCCNIGHFKKTSIKILEEEKIIQNNKDFIINFD